MDQNLQSPPQGQQHHAERGVKRPYSSLSSGNVNAGGAGGGTGSGGGSVTPTGTASTISRAAVSYPRKRAIAACQVCRGRKTKCDNERPSCGFCRQAGAVCVYEGDKQATFDAASLAILDKLAKIEGQLDLLIVPSAGQTLTSGTLASPTPHMSQLLPPIQYPTALGFKPYILPPQQSLPLTPPIQNSLLTVPNSAGGIPQASITSMITKPLIQSAGMLEGQSRQYKEPAKIASVGVTIQAVLRWPIFGGSYDADSILAPIFEDDDPDDDEDGDNVKDNLNSHKSKSDRGGNTISEENQLLNCDLKHLIGRFLTNVQTKNPILDQNILEAYTNEIRANGFDESGKTCIVLMVCALGAVSAPYSECVPNSPKSSTLYPNLIIGKNFYEAAKKRFTIVLRNKLTTVQCLFLAGMYCMYTMQQFAAWKMFNAASVSCQAYLLKRRTWRGTANVARLRKRHLSTGEDMVLSEKAQNFEKRIYWSCLKSELELCVELDTYPSGLSELRYPHSFPSPPRLSQSPQPMPSTVGSGIATGGGEGAYPLSSVLNASSPTTMEQQSIPLSGTRTNHLRLHYHTGSTTANREEDEITWFYYLAEIALRKIESTIIESRALNKWKRNIQGHTGENEEDDEDGSQQEMGSRGVSSIYVQAPPSRPPRTPTQAEMEEFIFHTKMFESQLETWTQCLPAQVKFADLDPAPCTDERLQYLRGRLWKTKSDLYRPFTYHLIHHVHSPLHNQNVYNKVAAFAKKGLTYDMLFIKANVTEHRHHGAWLSLRGIGCGALVYLAARKSGHFKGLIPEGWDEAMEKAKVTLKYWGGQMGTKDSKLTYELICKVEEDWFGTRLRGGIMGFGDGGY